jgi:two-component system alkaline phosphatase synthesis response regulator PhoP
LLEAGSGGAAIIIAESERPDLILLDRNLPDMSGEEVLRTLRDSESTKNTPILIVSGDTARPNSNEAALNVAGYLVKPYDINDLLSRIDAIMEQSAQ